MGGKVIKMYEKRKINTYNKKYQGIINKNINKNFNKNYNKNYNKNFYSIYNDNYKKNNAVTLRYLDSNSKHLKPSIKPSYIYNGVPGGWNY